MFNAVTIKQKQEREKKIYMYKVKTIRGTIFCAPIKYSKEFVAALGNLVEGYLPVIVRDNGALPVFPVWQLSSPDDKEVILFNGEKIDLVQAVESEIDDMAIHTFSERCKIIFGKILEIKNHICTRIALAPSVIITENGVNDSSLYNRLYAIKIFEGYSLDSSDLSQVYRVDKKLGANDIKINHVANFHAESEFVINKIRKRYMGDFDINTMMNPEYKFSIDDMKAFFDFAPTSFTTFYNLYFKE